ncbi:M14 family zinc carboxypeptidase [Tenacibaculum sp. IB213877]|uniref:M14 family zinc carboxypeptidase n=1 Tax=Tenacibaculum sp. IB213877 TaxID=3097351 RepID=UPI002A5B0E89|nr:M14 family zinc carboxypeptidase [Tenacibaculum sp. IB213877]MDY0779478.1 M14 family zinc carboxypeptidase [Tenacibaculum sp. IB213877]
MNILNLSFLKEIYPNIKEKSLFGRWITFPDIQPLFKNLSEVVSYEILGTSEENRSIYKLKLGTGAKKILIWSQMHGNESTGTKAVFDFLNFVKKHEDDDIVQSILKECTIQIIPMLNPDGAIAYTRVNAHDIDLNRDAVDKKAKESKLLRSALDTFNPQFCFNLHDQRTIFGVEGTQNPATISFLAPSEEETRKLTKGRKQTMNVIVAMNLLLQQAIPNHVGRYTDEFYPTATGDNFQKLGHNTILIEAGHYPNDYEREEVRKFNFYALLQGLYHIALTVDYTEYKDYFLIPNNAKIFFDVINRIDKEKEEAYQYEDKIIDNQFTSTLVQKKVGDLSDYIGHIENVFVKKNIKKS